MALFGKRIEDLDALDISRVSSEALEEGQRLDFKEGHEHGTEMPVSKLSECVRDEVVAMANSAGGTIIIGISEVRGANGRRHRAGPIKPFSECVQKAVQLRQSLRATIGPELPGLRVRGIETSVDGSGVIVVNVNRSLSAPHAALLSKGRLLPKIRRDDCSEPMSMIELQELTLRIAREGDRLAARQDWLLKAVPPPEGSLSFTISVSFVPLDPLFVAGFPLGDAPPPVSVSARAMFDGSPHRIDELWDRGRKRQPTLRGERRHAQVLLDGLSKLGLHDYWVISELVYSDGSGILSGRYTKQTDMRPDLEVRYDDVLSTSLAAILTAIALREAANEPEARYVLQVHIQSPGILLFLPGGVEMRGKTLDPALFPLPSYPLESSDHIEILLKAISDDVHHAFGFVAPKFELIS